MKTRSIKSVFSLLSFGLLIAVLVLTAISANAQESAKRARLERSDWAPDVKRALNEFLDRYGSDSVSYDGDSYVVFDFDNTSAIFDVEEQLIVYQLETMAFAIQPDALEQILLTDLSDPEADLSSYGYIKGSYAGLIADISRAYERLWAKYGPFTPAGLPEERLAELHAEPDWQEFAAKMRLSYDLVCDVEPLEVAWPWIIYWFSGMTESEVYDLSRRSCEKYGKVESSSVVWESPKDIPSNVGPVSIEWTSGVSVTENTRELWKALTDNGVDVWVCSASAIDPIRAAIDVWGLHDYCKGAVAMTVKLDSEGKYKNAYDYETGFGYYSEPDGTWKKTSRPTKTQTSRAGKSIAIINAIAPDYSGKGPLAGFMDSTGDFNFCTEFKSLKLVVCFNRANRKPTDGGGLIAEIALYERDTLGYDLTKANAAGDVLYLLQGRDENGARTLRASSATLRLNEREEQTLAGPENYAQLGCIMRQKMTVKEALDFFAVKRGAEENEFGARSGFLDEYMGYRSR